MLSKYRDKVHSCIGEGQSSCRSCNNQGIWNRHWHCMCYKIDGYDGVYCRLCTEKFLENGELEFGERSENNVQ